MASMKHYGLDPLYYVSLASYAWDVMLKVTEVELENITDIQVYNWWRDMSYRSPFV